MSHKRRIFTKRLDKDRKKFYNFPMWPFTSKRKNGSPGESGAGEFTTIPELQGYIDRVFEKHLEVLEAHQADLTTINTAINRIERKQNRWLEVLNLQDASKASSELIAAPSAPVENRLDALLTPGAETEE